MTWKLKKHELYCEGDLEWIERIVSQIQDYMEQRYATYEKEALSKKVKALLDALEEYK